MAFRQTVRVLSFFHPFILGGVMTASDSTKAQDLARVRGTLGLAVLFLMLGLAPSANAQLPSTDHDVVVVGAGAAG